MNTLKANSKYLIVVNLDNTIPDSVADKLKEAGIDATVLGIPANSNSIEFYEIKLPFWKRL